MSAVVRILRHTAALVIGVAAVVIWLLVIRLALTGLVYMKAWAQIVSGNVALPWLVVLITLLLLPLMFWIIGDWILTGILGALGRKGRA